MSAETSALHSGPDSAMRRWIVTVCAMMATLMQALDTTIANVALPYMRGSLSATSVEITWVLTSYIVAAAIMTAPVGWLSARFGQRALLITSLIGFTAASMLCGLAQSLDQLVMFRIVQGLFGAALVPLSQSIVIGLYPPHQRGMAMAIWGMGVMVGPILGPTLGGYLTQLYTWRYVFFVNLPFGLLATTGLVLFFTGGARREAGKFDWIGFTVLGIGVGALQMMLDRGQLKNWFSSTEIVTEAVLAGLGIYLFVVQTMTAKRPLLGAAMFRDLNLIAGCIIGSALFMILYATNALLAPYLQTLDGYPVETAGLLMAPRGLGTMLTMLIGGRLIARIDARLLMATGLLMIAASLWYMTGWTPNSRAFEIMANAVVQGMGFGLVFIPLTVVAFTTLPSELQAEGTAFFNLVRNVGGAIGISITSFLRVQNTQIVHAHLATHVNPFNRVLQLGGSFDFWNIVNPGTIGSLNTEITRQAANIAYIDDFKLLLLLSLATLPLLLLARTKQAAQRPNPPPE